PPAQELGDTLVTRKIEVLQPFDPAVPGRQAAELLEDGAVAGLPEPGQPADLRQRRPALEVGPVRDVPAQEMTRLLALPVTGRQAGVPARRGLHEPTPYRER